MRTESDDRDSYTSKPTNKSTLSRNWFTAVYLWTQSRDCSPTSPWRVSNIMAVTHRTLADQVISFRSSKHEQRPQSRIKRSRNCNEQYYIRNILSALDMLSKELRAFFSNLIEHADEEKLLPVFACTASISKRVENKLSFVNVEAFRTHVLMRKALVKPAIFDFHYPRKHQPLHKFQHKCEHVFYIRESLALIMLQNCIYKCSRCHIALYAPLTRSGTLLADGVLASNYARVPLIATHDNAHLLASIVQVIHDVISPMLVNPLIRLTRESIFYLGASLSSF